MRFDTHTPGVTSSPPPLARVVVGLARLVACVTWGLGGFCRGRGVLVAGRGAGGKEAQVDLGVFFV